MGRARTFSWLLLIGILLPSAFVLPGRGDGNPVAALRTLSAGRAERVERAGLPNFFRVSENLYRGGQPGRNGVRELQRLGVRTVISLRQSKTDTALFRGSGIDCVSIPMSAFFPKREGFRRFLEIVSDPNRVPVFVHCRHGSDRTGAAVALYRIHVQGWTSQEAIREMAGGGYGFHWIHGHLKRFVRRF